MASRVSVLQRLTIRNLLFWTTMLAWSLWFGATIALFIFVQHLFAVFPREVAGQAANQLFLVFAKYEMILALICVLASGMLMVTYPTARWVLLLGGLVLASGLAMTVAMGLMPMMEILIREGKQHTTEFGRLHGKSMMLMMIQSAVLLMSGVIVVLTGEVPQSELSPRNPMEDHAGVPIDKLGLGKI